MTIGFDEEIDHPGKQSTGYIYKYTWAICSRGWGLDYGALGRAGLDYGALGRAGLDYGALDKAEP